MFAWRLSGGVCSKKETTGFLNNMTSDLPRLSLVADHGLRIRNEGTDAATGHWPKDPPNGKTAA